MVFPAGFPAGFLGNPTAGSITLKPTPGIHGSSAIELAAIEQFKEAEPTNKY